MVGAAVGAGTNPPRRMMMRIPKRLKNNTRLAQPIITVPARLEFKNLLMEFIPYYPLRCGSCIACQMNYKTLRRATHNYKTSAIVKGYV
jgi:hypothetical protein